MNLAQYQNLVFRLLMTRDGKMALDDAKSLTAFLEQHNVPAPVREALLNQPIKRLQQYDYMVLANMVETLDNIFPVSRKLVRPAWERLVMEYAWQHPPQGYRMMAVGAGFPEHLAVQFDWLEKYPFLGELAEYEWLEAELLNAPNPVLPEHLCRQLPQTRAEMKEWAPVLNPVSRLCAFEYPLPVIVDHLRSQPAETLPPIEAGEAPIPVWIYRTPAAPFYCRFFQLNPLLAAWFQQVMDVKSDGPPASYALTMDPLLVLVASQNPHISTDKAYEEFLRCLPTLVELGILLGSEPV